jgi:outer membrane biosynthesis protein TonB
MNPTKAPTRRKEARQPGAGSHSMRRYTLFSVGIHIAFISLISFPLVRPHRPILAEPIYEVALIKWPESNYLPPKPAQAREREKPVEKLKPRPKQKDEVVVPKEKTPRPKPTPKTEPEEKTPATSPKLVEIPNAPEDPVSLGMVDQRDFKHDYYLELLRGILARAWDPPRGGTGVIQTSLHFIIQRDGSILDPKVTVTSGWNLYDRSAMGAVLGVKKLPPLPEAYSGDQLGLTVNFQRMGDGP